MKRREFLGASLALAATAMLPGCASADDTPSYRYRLSVEVETPEGPVTGSSVIEIDVSDGISAANPAGSQLMYKVRGEAVAIDLPKGQTIFALLRSQGENGGAHRVMPRLTPDQGGEGDARIAAKYKALIANKNVRELPRMWPKIGFIEPQSAYPMLVTFGDMDDPTSVAQLDPDNLAATFGEGYALKRFTVQVTNDPVTTGIEKRLGWFRERAKAGGGLIPMVKNEQGRWEAVPGYDESLVEIGLSNFSTEAYKL